MPRETSVLQVLSQVEGPMVAADHLGRIRQVTKQAAEMLGYRPRELEDRPLLAIIPERYWQRHLESFRRYVLDGTSRLEGQTVRVHARTADGSERAIDLTIRVFKAASREPVAVAMLAPAIGGAEHGTDDDGNGRSLRMQDVERYMAQARIKRL